MVKSFKTIKKATTGFFKDRGSKFYGFAYPVTKVEDVKTLVDKLKKEYFDARHHCFAYSIGTGAQVALRANDDGEPNHSAGDPILGQIKSLELTDVLVVVVRYFGGTKLGVSGLIHAYRETAQLTLVEASILTKFIKSDLSFSYNYDVTNEVQRLLNEFDIEIIDQNFSDHCQLKGRIDPDHLEALRKKLLLLDIALD